MVLLTRIRSELGHPPPVTVPEAVKLGLLLSLRHVAEPLGTDARALEDTTDELAVCPPVHLVVVLLTLPHGRRRDEDALVGRDVEHRRRTCAAVFEHTRRLVRIASEAGGARGMISVQDVVGHIALCLFGK